MALAEAIRLGGDITVNMRALRFTDVSCARMIVDAARRLAPPPRTVVLQCSPAAARAFRLLDAADVPGVSVVTVDDG